ncbi:MAG: hypothetical protein ABSH47_14050 [Bryobacteraceae bacterium]|jgi:hypothetical protein
MPSTVVGRFHLVLNVEQAIRELERAGFTRGEISLVGSGEPWDETLAAQTLIGMHVPEDDAHDYTRAVEEGSAVLVVQTDNHKSAERALAVFEQTASLSRLHKALSGGFAEPADEPGIQAAHLRNGARPRTSEPPRNSARIYDCVDPVASAAGFEDFDADWRRGFRETFQGSGYRYEQLWPAYRYGGELAVSRRFGRREWKDIERAVRRDWEQRNPHTWEQARNAIRYAWQSVRARITTPVEDTVKQA